MVRLDYSGSPHDNRDSDGNITIIETPHVHIFSDEYNNGAKAISLDDLSDYEIINPLRDSLIAFMLYNNVNINNISIPFV